MPLRNVVSIALFSFAAGLGAGCSGTITFDHGAADDDGSGADAAPGTDAGDPGAPDAAPETPPGWKLVWSDEFEGKAGQAPESGTWRHDVSGDGFGNNQLEFDTDRTDNAALDGQGHLAIVAKREQFQGNAYTSARLNTSGHFTHGYGRFEARLQVPTGRGVWPAFWLLGNNIGDIGWPDCGELDIMEHNGGVPGEIRGSAHGPGYSGGANVGKVYQVPGGNLERGFHVYGIEWDPDKVVWFVDDVPYLTVTPDDIPGGTRWVYDHDFFVILNVAIGGGFVDPPDDSTPLPQSMLVDYVRVFERE
jgi:beta-glucanase (GH16 family)